MSLKIELLDFCNSLGLQNVGLIKCRKFEELRSFYENRKALNLENEFEEEDIEKRINPNIYMEEGKTIVSIAFPYSCAENYKDNGFSIYTRGIDYHKVVSGYLNKICDFIVDKGGNAKYFVDSNSLPERYIAYIAGVGFIGKNNLLITKEYGSYVFLGEIITDLEIYDNDKGDFKSLVEHKECGTCEKCFLECPTKSINKSRKNPNICLSYLTQKKELEDWEMKALNGRVFGCDSCQNKCPYNEDAKKTNIDEFKVLDFMNEDNEEIILNMSNGEFKKSFKNTSCGWRGKNVLKRNVVIRKALCKKQEIKGLKNDSEYVQRYIDRLL